MAATTYLRHSSKPRVSTVLSGELRPGYGLPKLHLGMTREQCRAAFGDPDDVRSFPDGTFFQYLRRGFDIDYELGSKAKRLFFYRSGIQRHTAQCNVRYKDITFGTSAEQVKRLLGTPARTGHVGKKTWMFFDNGLQFDFDSRGKLEVLIVFQM